jgi:hypothetical protein
MYRGEFKFRFLLNRKDVKEYARAHEMGPAKK